MGLIILGHNIKFHPCGKYRGEMVEGSIRKEIKNLDGKIASLQEIDVEIIDKVALHILDLKPKTVNEISAEIEETTKDVQIALEELKLERLVVSNKIDDSQFFYRIVTNIESLFKLTEKLMAEKEKKIDICLHNIWN